MPTSRLPAASGAGVSTLAPCRGTHRSPRHSRGVAVRAGGDRQDVDWDREWNSFVNTERKAGGASSGARPRANVRTSSRAVPVDPAAKMTRDAIKREESLLLNAWSSKGFQGLGAGVAVLVLLAVLLAAGPPPADSRCTLPWC